MSLPCCLPWAYPDMGDLLSDCFLKTFKQVRCGGYPEFETEFDGNGNREGNGKETEESNSRSFETEFDRLCPPCFFFPSNS